MEMFKKLILMALLLTYCQSIPIENERTEVDPEFKGGFFEGDMDVDIERNGIRDISQRWPNGKVRFKINPVFDVNHSLYILKGMQIIESISCIRFLHVTDTTQDFIRITGKTNGCNSKVGYIGTEQHVNLDISPLDEGCFRIGTIIHELLHALGFYHQHSASDRDDYIRIIFNNIQDNMAFNFEKFGTKTVTDFGIEYDYGSVMHYGRKAFSKNGQDTIIPLKGDNVKIGQRDGLSAGDIKKLNRMYNC